MFLRYDGTGWYVVDDDGNTSAPYATHDEADAAADALVPSALVRVGEPSLWRFDFTYDTPGLADGVPVFTPQVGDVLLHWWTHTTIAFDGTTPGCDLLVSGTEGVRYGADTSVGSLDLEGGPYGGMMVSNNTPSSDVYANGYGVARFVSTDPLLLVVSQDGFRGGDPIGGTQGAASLYLVIAGG